MRPTPILVALAAALLTFTGACMDGADDAGDAGTGAGAAGQGAAFGRGGDDEGGDGDGDRGDGDGGDSVGGDGDGGDGDGGDGDGSDGMAAPAGASPLEAQFPVAENGPLPSRLDQSFICIDEIDLMYYEVEFAPDGSATEVASGTSLSYATEGRSLTLDLTEVYGDGVSYQHAAHITAGELVVGFVGAASLGGERAVIACIAARHDFSDRVPETTTIVCEGSNTDVNFASTSTNRFTLESTHYAQRYFNGATYVSFDANQPGDPTGVSTEERFTQHGTYLFDAGSGTFVMGFLEVDVDKGQLDLLVFEGASDGERVEVVLGDEARECAFE